MSPLGTATVIQGDARALPLPDASVDLICTSPPYFALRSYQDGGQHYDGQIGSEDTPQQWLDNLWECTREMVRVLKPEGSIFVNLGDKYASGGGLKGQSFTPSQPRLTVSRAGRRTPQQLGTSEKSLMGLPWRYAIGAMDRLGLILRAEIIWAKPNGLPESVTDRVRRSHETWFHLVKQPRYFSAVDEIREPHAPWRPSGANALAGQSTIRPRGQSDPDDRNPLGKLPGSVWTVPTEPLQTPAHLGVDHFAAYPTEWPRRIITGWTPAGICVECGEGRRPVHSYEEASDYFGPTIEERKRQPTTDELQAISLAITTARVAAGLSRTDVSERVVGTRSGACWNWEAGISIPTPTMWRALKTAIDLPSTWDHVMLDTVQRPTTKPKDGERATFLGGLERHRTGSVSASTRSPSKQLTGYVCGCPIPSAPTTPSTVVDPFGGTGTTALVAKALGRHGITVDLSADYCRMARWRTNDPGELAKAARVPKPPSVMDGQMSLLDGGAA